MEDIDRTAILSFTSTSALPGFITELNRSILENLYDDDDNEVHTTGKRKVYRDLSFSVPGAVFIRTSGTVSPAENSPYTSTNENTVKRVASQAEDSSKDDCLENKGYKPVFPDTRTWTTELVVVDGDIERSKSRIPFQYLCESTGPWEVSLNRTFIFLEPKETSSTAVHDECVYNPPHLSIWGNRPIDWISVEINGQIDVEYLKSRYGSERWEPYIPPGGLDEWDRMYGCILRYRLKEDTNGEDRQASLGPDSE